CLSIDSPDRDLRPRATKRATMLFPGRNRDTLRDCEESEKCGGSLFGRRASLVALSASAGSSSRGHGEGLPSLLSLPYQRDHPEVTEKDLLRFLRIFRRATGHVAATQLRGTPDGQRVGESEGRGGCPATASVGSSGDGESAPSCRSFSPECRG